MKKTPLLRASCCLLAFSVIGALGAWAVSAGAATTSLSNTPLSSASSVSIKPNILFMLDDSGSMDWDFLPDWAGATTQVSQLRNPSFNGIAYNPNLVYQLPKYFSSTNTADTTTYPSQTSAATNNWTAVKNDGYGVQSTGTSNLTGVALYYTTVPGEYCSDKAMRNCIAASAPSAPYTLPARLRWCQDAASAAAATPAVGKCQATQVEPTGSNTPYNYPRMPAPRTSALTASGSGSTAISSIKVDGKEILSAATAASAAPDVLGDYVVNAINACTYARTGNCETEGYSASIEGAQLIIVAPGVTSSMPVVTKSGAMSIAATAFARPSGNLAPGENLLTVINPNVIAYANTSGRSNCVGSTVCTYAEEMTNYANWWAYYRTRMQTMKTAASLSFAPIGNTYRIGYASINNNTGSDFQNIDVFENTQKKNWYDKLFAAVPNHNTPLRASLAKAGRLYAGRLNGSTFNNVNVVDPMQYYCQPNVTILSTDGYWNETAGFKLDNSAIGDQDGPDKTEPGPVFGSAAQLVQRPQLDGGGPQDVKSTEQITKTLTPTLATQWQQKTSQWQSHTAVVIRKTLTQQQQRTSQLQSQTAQQQSSYSRLQFREKVLQGSTKTQWQEKTAPLQKRTGTLQTRTAQLQKQTKTQPQYRTSQLQQQIGQRQQYVGQLQTNITQVQQNTSSNGGISWNGWSNVASCSPVTSGTTRIQCRTLPASGWNDTALACTRIVGGTSVANAGTDSEKTTYTTDVNCQYANYQWQNTATCTLQAPSASPNYTVVNPVTNCQTVWSGTWTAASSCTTSETSQCQYTAWTTYTNWTDAGSCTNVAQSSGSPYTVGQARQCAVGWSGWEDTGSTCTTSSTTACQYRYSTWQNTSSCTPSTPVSTGSPYNIISATECQVVYGAWQNNQTSCTADNSGMTRTQCQYGAWSATWSNVGSCTENPTSGGPNYTGPARQCQVTWTSYSNNPGCVPSATTQCQSVWSSWYYVPSGGSCTAVADTRECRYSYDGSGTEWSPWSNTGSCTPQPQSTSSPYTVLMPVQCQTTWPNTWVNAASCTPSSTVQCQYGAWGSWSDIGTCNAVAQDTTNYSVAQAKECQTVFGNSSVVSSCTGDATTQCFYQSYDAWQNWTAASTCTAVAPTPTGNGLTNTAGIECQIVPISDWTNQSSCTPGTVNGLISECQQVVPPPTSAYTDACEEQAPSSGNGGVGVTCNTATTGPTDVSSCTPAAATAANNYIKTLCSTRQLGPTPDTLADVAQYYWATDLRDPSLGNCTGGPVVSGASTSTNNVCANDSNVLRQNMNTYTLGLGASGLMQYDEQYATLPSGDFYSVKTGADAATGACPWQKNGVCNWPKPESNKQTNIDDLWHAAVNGRGAYFSATDPNTLAAGISKALGGVNAQGGALAAPTYSNPNLTAGANDFYALSFKVGEWTGDLLKLTLDGTTLAESSTPLWSAQAQLDNKVNSNTHTARKIFTYNPGGSSGMAAADNLKLFAWDQLSTAEQANFGVDHIATLSQFCSVGVCLSSTQKALAADENLLNFIRGDKTNENSLYRSRVHLLGDIVNSEAVYVQAPPWNYVDYGYATFKTNNAARAARLYVGANDGMLHAFKAGTGEEAWAYIPSIVLPDLFRLADKNYAAQHRFFVDGTPVTGDICVSDCNASSATWKTILVGGLNNGGRGYYALDVTDPDNPKALWEFTDDNLGYTYGNPVITKLKDGTWVVLVSSGYNNISPGDGKGYLFVIKAADGSLLRTIGTGEGSTTTPSGLAKITAWADYAIYNNTALRAYGGDLLGNLWRFDINGDIPSTIEPPTYDAQRLATLKDSSGVAQPVTTRPELGKVGVYPVVFVGTGQLLGSEDIGSTQTQSFYAIKERLLDADYGNPRNLASFVQQPMESGTCSASGDAFCPVGTANVTNTLKKPVSFKIHDGWYVDFPVGGERINVDPSLFNSVLLVVTNTPTSGACVPAGISYLYAFDYATGSAVPGATSVGVKIADRLSSRVSALIDPDGNIFVKPQTDHVSNAPATGGGGSGTGGGTVADRPNIDPKDPLSSTSARRVSWRELVTE